MVDVMSFTKDKKEKFSRCPNCYSETKHRILERNELDFEKLLDDEIHKIK